MHLGTIAGLFLALLFSATPHAAADPNPGLFDRPVLSIDPGRHTAKFGRAGVDAKGLTAVTGAHDKTVRLWSVADGKLLRTIRMPTGPDNVGQIFAVAISHDGATVAAGGWTRWRAGDAQEQVYLFDAATGVMTGRLTGLPSSVNILTFSADGRRLAAMLQTGLRLYRRGAEGGWTEEEHDEDYGSGGYGAAFALDGRLATTSWDGRVRLYDVEGRLVGSVATGHSKPMDVSFSPDGNRLAVGIYDSTAVELFDGRTLEALPGPDTGGIDNGDLSCVAWSVDGATLFASGKYSVNGIHPVIAWGDGGRGARRAFPAGQDTVMGLTPLPGGDLLVASHDPLLGVIRSDGTLRWTLPPLQMDPRAQKRTLSASTDGAVVDFGLKFGGKNRVRFDVSALSLSHNPPDDGRTRRPHQDGLEIANWEDKQAPSLGDRPLSLAPYERSRSLAIHPDGKRFLLGADWSLRAFEADGTELWQRAVPSAVWAVNISGDGRLAVAAYGDGTIRWHTMDDGSELLALFPFADGRNWIAWEPDGRFASTPGARGALRWVVNRGWDETPLELKAGEVPLSYRPEVIRRVLAQMGTPAAVYAAEEAERAEAFRRLTGGIAPGAQLHVLTAGVGDYGAAAQRLRLDFAAQDAADVAAALSGQVDWPYREGFRMTLRDSEAKRSELFRHLGNIRDRMKLAPDGRDLAVFMFSGHGTVVGEGDDAEFYLLPHGADVSSPWSIKDSGLSGTDLRRELAAIAAYGRVLVLLDTCSSGAMTGDRRSLGAGADVVRRVLAGRNITVLASSGATEISRERVEWGNGAFTEVLLEALGKAGDTDGTGMVSVQELAGYIDRRLPVLTGRTQTSAIETHFSGDLFSSGL